jgi:hypothetical protein
MQSLEATVITSCAIRGQNTRKAKDIKSASSLTIHPGYMHGYQIIKNSDNNTQSTTERAISRTSNP